MYSTCPEEYHLFISTYIYTCTPIEKVNATWIDKKKSYLLKTKIADESSGP